MPVSAGRSSLLGSHETHAFAFTGWSVSHRVKADKAKQTEQRGQT